MPKRSRMEELDQAVQKMLERSEGGVLSEQQDADPELTALLGIAADLRELPRMGFKARLKSELEEETRMGTVTVAIPKGFRTITPYLVAQDAAGLIDFVKQVFGAKENFRAIGSAGGIHCDLDVGDSKLMIGGGGPGLSWRGESNPAALHVYVEDTDRVYQRALEAGGIPLQPPADQPYGERGGSLKDQSGNHWYIATSKGDQFVPEGLFTINPYLHPLRADSLIQFLKHAFGAEEVSRYASPDGVVHHASVRVGTSILEMGEAHGPYQPMASMFYLYVPDVDATYAQAIAAGAHSTSEPGDQPYGDRTASVKDAFGHLWYIATHVRDATG